jgi:DNA-binding transcriptional LysR family regulator
VGHGHDLDWNDWRAFLAVARSGSTLAAARLLTISQPTIARRLSAAQSCASSFAREISGTVRVTAGEIFAVTWLTPALLDFRERYPGIVIELDSCDEFRDLAGGEADVALRSTWSVAEPGLVGRRLCDEDWTFYGGPAYAERRGLPDGIAALKGHAILGGGGTAWPAYENWLRRYGLLDCVVLHHRSIAGLIAAVRQGLGLSALPCWIAEFEPGLIRCFPPPRSGRGLWLLAHETRCRQPHVRVVIDFLYDKLSARIKATQPWPIRVDPPLETILAQMT